MSLLSAPFEILQTLGQSLRALAELPVTIDRNLRDTNALISEARSQLARLGEQVGRMMDQLDTMATVTDRLVDGAKSIATAAHDTQEHLVSMSAHLAAANRSLEQIVHLAAPLDRMGKRVAKGLQRVTGRGSLPPEGSGG